jgi:ribonuclease P protein component
VTASVSGESNQDAAPRTGKNKFPRSARLLRHADFERVYKQGRRHFSASMTVFFFQRQQPGPDTKKIAGKPVGLGLRIGFTVGRALGGAVERNRMKRRLREGVRLSFPAAAANADVVINPKKSLLKIDFASIVIELQHAFEVIERKLENKAGSNIPAAAARKSFAKPKP